MPPPSYLLTLFAPNHAYSIQPHFNSRIPQCYRHAARALSEGLTIFAAPNCGQAGGQPPTGSALRIMVGCPIFRSSPANPEAVGPRPDGSSSPTRSSSLLLPPTLCADGISPDYTPAAALAQTTMPARRCPPFRFSPPPDQRGLTDRLWLRKDAGRRLPRSRRGHKDCARWPMDRWCRGPPVRGS